MTIPSVDEDVGKLANSGIAANNLKWRAVCQYVFRDKNVPWSSNILFLEIYPKEIIQRWKGLLHVYMFTTGLLMLGMEIGANVY